MATTSKLSDKPRIVVREARQVRKKAEASCSEKGKESL